MHSVLRFRKYVLVQFCIGQISEQALMCSGDAERASQMLVRYNMPCCGRVSVIAFGLSVRYRY